MNNLKNKISTEYLKSFKERNTIRKNILGVVKSSIQTEEKNLNIKDMDDNGVMKILNKILKGLNETISLSNDEESKLQLKVVEEFLPKRLSRDEIKSKIDFLRSKDQSISIGSIMKEFANDPVDKKMVSEIYNNKI